MKIINMPIYNIDELSKEAKENAYYKWLNNYYYLWHDENMKTLNAFENIFPIKITSYEYDTCGGYIHFDFLEEDSIASLSNIRLMKYIYNNYFYDIYKGKYYSLWSKTNKKSSNAKLGVLKSKHSNVIFDNSCVLTGYYLDDEILKPIYDFLKCPKNINFYSLMRKCLNNWINACIKDYEYCTSMEYFLEEANDFKHEYFKDGRRYA